MHKVITINWQQLCLNLRSVIPTKELALRLGVSISCINTIAAGNIVDPSFSIGVNLLNIHLDYVGEAKHKKLFMGKK